MLVVGAKKSSSAPAEKLRQRREMLFKKVE